MFDQVRIELILKDGPVDHVAERLDLAFQLGPLTDANLVARKLWSAKKVLFASPDYLQRRGEPRSAADLCHHDFIVVGRSLEGATIQINSPENTEPISIHGRFSVDSAAAAVRAATLGLGIVALPELLATGAVKSGQLRYVLARHEVEAGAIYATYASKHHMSAALRLFLDFVADKHPH
ncbi:hypothetical protein EHI45_16365 [Rhizobium leguminosarum]|uniref:substrate binding domain-containing protein n=1 Tax=Rhizobium leguminosarum TaxID=384 RepID=UPI000FEC8D17|nr:substrate binding domain-containing protein [Rhizobium leguminosarum]RWX12876.1 hypothetical protein EHI45_16365 [Rhizobium leguminosarum]